MARENHEQDTVRRYLLKQLSAAEQQEIELRLLTDDSFSQELEIVEDELIDEYVENEFSRHDRLSFEENFLTNPERYGKLQSGQVFKRYFSSNPPEPVSQPGIFGRLANWLRSLTSSPSSVAIVPSSGSLAFLSSPASMVAITLLVVAGVGLIVWRAVFYQSDLEKGLLALNEAYRQERPVEARVSTLDYAPFVITRGNEPERVNTLELNRAQRFLLDTEKEHPGAASFHALGKLFLLQRDLDKAIEYLDNAARADPTNAQIYADLGAAYLEKGRLELAGSKSDPAAGKGLEDLGHSLEYLKKALELNPNLREALFNLSLVHQHQGLYQEAEADWRRYLEKDSSSQWAVEARQYLKLLEERKTHRSQNSGHTPEAFIRAYYARDDTAAWEIYRRNHAPAGNQLAKALVDRFLADSASNKTAENLEILEYLGQLEMRQTQDSYTSDLAKVYASASAQTRTLLDQARKQVAKGYELFGQSKIGEATELFENARQTFDKVGDVPELLAAEAAMAHAAAVEPDLAKGQEILARIVPACESRRYSSLLGQLLTDRAHIQSNLNNYSEAISDGNRALQIFLDRRDLSSTLGNFIQLASLHLFLNDNETSFSFLRRAMATAEEEGASAMQRWGIYIAVSLNLSVLKLYGAALDYQKEALQLALASGVPLYISRSYQYVGLTYGSLQQFDLAIENVRLAYEQGKSLATERNGHNMIANASLRLGDLYRVSGDETNALAAYEESLRLYDTLGFAHYSYAAHKGKFLSYLAQNNDGLAAQELRIVLKLFDEYREKILEERQKSFFFDREQDIYDLAIDFAYFRLGDQRRAFDYSETCRARNLRELMRRGAEVTLTPSGLDLRSAQFARSESGLPLTATEIQQQLPEQVQIVQYAVLEKKLLVWRITRSDVFTSVVELDSSKLVDTVATALKQIRQRDQSGAAASLKALYSLLIEPIGTHLDPKLVLCFVPDKILHYLPFGALIASSGRYLVQDYRVMTSPSATILIESTNKAHDRALDQGERLLAVGNPTLDRSESSNLADLASAEREVEEIAPSYPSRRVLIGPQATRGLVIKELAQAHIAHFAAHYRVDERSALSSRLLLSPEPGERSHAQLFGLASGDIYQMDLARTKLVVLSACQTGIEQQLRGEGPIGFARSFLVAGVPVVVASLWPVDSEATAELMVLFHRFRRLEHLSVTQALTRAQQEIMTRENYHHPYYWAGFTAIGGYSDF